ncbi:peptidase S10 serine carboxypeptidase [Punctularia strigosozonata HHB-11173 SS5]|uniref:peptidase S10 serine carboxypeptidase n=1 Tax=Punctularia strigosozonata (strain HHB-11173) TaxID=741275 RepID=UPI0004417A6D|nr:peptidase S10 serine carboxypeptidase [Punctularia strigosozonata HHB-11173 SS5]EIN10271.1 peptidase S10 serine carboxypeptidase [Punctularia strigosozonata HHB-11173 SS5]
MLSHLLVVLGLALLQGAQAAWRDQSVLGSNALPTAHVSELLLNASEIHLSSITNTHGYVALTHAKYPSHQVRVKKTDFCDPTVNVYTGYLDVDDGAKHLFFTFFESRRDPDNDDVMMWINGGPGCSSMMGLLMELGPCQIDMNNSSSNGTVWNRYSWNSEANMFFLDQPVGVGFSYAEFGETISTTEDAAKNVHAFITIFFETFKQFAGRPLHLSGESYGGRYLPVFASEIYDQNQIAKAENRTVINLQSVLIGNGITDISTLYEGRYAIECGTSALEVPFQSISTCVRMKTALPRCQAAMRTSCIDSFDAMNCGASVAFCDSQLSTGYWASGRNVYDISKPCLGDGLCYLENGAIKAYLDRPETRELLGVETPNNFSACSRDVGAGFAAHLDKWAVPTQYYVAGLLERGVRVLIYAGTYDWQCNWVANKLWVDKLEWSGHEEYVKAEWRDWRVGEDGEKAGETKSAAGGLLTFATVRGAGHMVPHDKPAESLAMVSRWLAGADL